MVVDEKNTIPTCAFFTKRLLHIFATYDAYQKHR